MEWKRVETKFSNIHQRGEQGHLLGLKFALFIESYEFKNKIDENKKEMDTAK